MLEGFFKRRVVPDSSGDIVKDFVRIADQVKNRERDKSIKDAFEAGEQHILDRQYNQAVEKFGQVIAQDRKNHARALACRGSAYLGLKNYKEALKDLNQSLELGKDNLYALAHRGVTHRKMGHYKEARADFQRVLALGYSRPWIEKELKDLYKILGDECQKPKVVDKPIDDESRQKAIKIHYHSGIKYMREERYPEAVEKFKQVIAHDKKNAKAYALCGKAYRKMGQYDKARANFTRALGLGFSRLWAVEELADLHNIHRKSMKEYYDAGIKYMREGRYQKAVEEFNQIIKRDMYDARAVIYRGAAYLEWKQDKKALADFKPLLDRYLQPWIEYELKKLLHLIRSNQR